MAALYAQGLAWECMHDVVREYAGAMGSVRHLLSDLTLPIISVFSGAGFDRVIRHSFQHGAQRIEDLWLRCGLVARALASRISYIHNVGPLQEVLRRVLQKWLWCLKPEVAFCSVIGHSSASAQ